MRTGLWRLAAQRSGQRVWHWCVHHASACVPLQELYHVGYNWCGNGWQRSADGTCFCCRSGLSKM